MKLVTTLIANTKGEGKAGDDFWVKAETLLYCALIGYIHYEAPVEEQNFSTLIEMINSMEVREDDEEFKNAVDLMFDELEGREAQPLRGAAVSKIQAGGGQNRQVDPDFLRCAPCRVRHRGAAGGHVLRRAGAGYPGRPENRPVLDYERHGR